MIIDLKQAKNHGYLVCVTDSSDTIIPHAQHIEVDGEHPKFENDYEAAKQAERDGIPIIHDIPGCEDWTYVDTPENRKLVTNAIARYPRFDCRTWGKSDAPEWTTATLIASDLEVAADGKTVEATFECWASWAEKFGINFDVIEDQDQDEAWLNLFATYTPETGSLTMFFVVDSGSRHEQLSYSPKGRDRVTVIAAMELAAQREANCTLAELVMRYNEEQKEKKLCEVIFGFQEKEEMPPLTISVIIEIEATNHVELGEQFTLTVEERQAAYDLAANAVGEEMLQDCVIRSAYVFRSRQHLLVEATNGQPYELFFYESHDAAFEAMFNRVAEVREVPYDELFSVFSIGVDFDEQTCIEESLAETQRCGDPYNWRIFTIDPIPGARIVDKDTRCVIISVFNNKPISVDFCLTEEAARFLMFSKAGAFLQLSGEAIQRQFHSNQARGVPHVNWALKNASASIHVEADHAIAECQSDTHSWCITTVDDYVPDSASQKGDRIMDHDFLNTLVADIQTALAPVAAKHHIHLDYSADLKMLAPCKTFDFGVTVRA